MGRDKASLPWGQSTLLVHLVQKLSSRLSPLILAGKSGMLPNQNSAVITTIDEKEHQGPLAGLLAGLSAAPADQLFFLSGCDYPFLECWLIDLLHKHLGEADGVLLESQGHLQPLLGLYQPRIYEHARKLFEQGKRSLTALIDCLNIASVPESIWIKYDPGRKIMININTPLEYEAAHQVYLASLTG